MVEKREDAGNLEAISNDLPKLEAEKPVEVVIKRDDKDAEPDDLRRELEDYKKRLEEQAQARFEAEKRERDALQRAAQSASEVYDSNLHLVASALETTRNQGAILRAQQAEAMAVGDYARAAEIMEAMGRNSRDYDNLASGYEKMRVQPRPQTQPQQNSQSANPLDDLIHVVAQSSPRSAAWLERNRGKITDPKMLNKIRRAHEDAVDDGYTPDSDDYFGYVENRLGFSRRAEPVADEPFSSAAAPTARRSAPAAAPVSRSGNPTQSRPGRITLTPEQKEAAEINKMSYEEYYERVIEEKNRRR